MSFHTFGFAHLIGIITYHFTRFSHALLQLLGVASSKVAEDETAFVALYEFNSRREAFLYWLSLAFI